MPQPRVGGSDPVRDWVPIMVFLSFLLPQEARLELGDFTLYSYRLALFIAAPFAIKRLLVQPIRFTLADASISFASAWITVATLQNYGLERAMVSGGVLSLDMLLAYFVGRIYIRSGLQLRRLLYAVAPFVALVGLLIMIESVSHTYIVRRVFGAIFGISPDAILNKTFEIRLGLLRGTGPFQHPISGGMLLGSLIPLYFYADLPRRTAMGLLAGLLGIFTLSSAALLSIAGSIALVGYDRIRRFFRMGWMPLIYALAVGLLLLELVSNNGAVNVIIRNLALNPATGYFRQLIWDYGWADVGRHPWYGIGLSGSYYRPYWMATDSIDNHWLFLALRFGIPCLVAVLFCILANLVSLALSPATAEPEAAHGRSMKTGVSISMCVYLVLLLSQSPWQAEAAWLTMLVGIVGGLANPRRADIAVPTGNGTNTQVLSPTAGPFASR